MSKIMEFGGSGIDGTQQIDLHDKSIPLVDRVAFGLMFMNGICCDDFLCEDSELKEVIEFIETGGYDALPTTAETKH